MPKGRWRRVPGLTWEQALVTVAAHPLPLPGQPPPGLVRQGGGVVPLQALGGLMKTPCQMPSAAQALRRVPLGKTEAVLPGGRLGGAGLGMPALEGL